MPCYLSPSALLCLSIIQKRQGLTQSSTGSPSACSLGWWTLSPATVLSDPQGVRYGVTTRETHWWGHTLLIHFCFFFSPTKDKTVFYFKASEHKIWLNKLQLLHWKELFCIFKEKRNRMSKLIHEKTIKAYWYWRKVSAGWWAWHTPFFPGQGDSLPSFLKEIMLNDLTCLFLPFWRGIP